VEDHSNRATVLLVDRDEERRSDIALDLASAGFAVLSAADVGGAAAVLAGHPHPVAAVVADVDPGPAVSRVMKERNADTYAVLTRGLISPVPALRTYFLDRATPPASIARVVARLYDRPKSELSNT
jgi:DNA-binding response OmpR family regulator